MKSDLDKQQEVIQVIEARQKLMNIIPGTTTYHMGQWRRCEKDYGMIYESFHREVSEKNTVYAISGT